MESGLDFGDFEEQYPPRVHAELFGVEEGHPEALEPREECLGGGDVELVEVRWPEVGVDGAEGVGEEVVGGGVGLFEAHGGELLYVGDGVFW